MKKISFFINAKALTTAMLAVALVFGLAFVGCNNGTTEEPRTIESLFNKVKSFDLDILRAYINTNDEGIYYCYEHKVWEPWVSGVGLAHGGTPAFTLADADVIQGYTYNYYYNNANEGSAAKFATIKKLVPILDSFFSSEYKTGQPAVNTLNTTFDPDGTPLDGWISFRLYRSGEGRYGASTETTQTPCMADFYYFGE